MKRKREKEEKRETETESVCVFVRLIDKYRERIVREKER